MTNQPLISVDAVALRLTAHGLEVLLAERWNEPYAGKLALPGVLLLPNESLEEAAIRAVLDKTDIPSEKVRGISQLRAFDATNRDPRGSTISIACWVFVDPTTETSGTWMRVSAIEDLPFDHKNILMSAMKLLRNPSETLVWGILSEEFASGDYALLIESSSGDIDRTNLTRIIPSRLPHIRKTTARTSAITKKKSQYWALELVDDDLL